MSAPDPTSWARQKQIEKTLRERNADLESASRHKSEFLANMSHELRTPLNAIIGFSELLRDGVVGELTDQQRAFTGDIFDSGRHLLALINDILDLSRVEAGKMSLDLEPVELSPLLAGSLSMVYEKAGSRKIRVDLAAAEDLGWIQADARKLKQILYNLLSNAVKFADDGGRVTLRARRVPRADVGHGSGTGVGRSFPLGESAFAEFVAISVTDSGIGISPDDLEHLFKPFSQFDGVLRRRLEGTGLGLAMVKLLAELHGGTVAVTSAVGAGSCFEVWLPFRPPDDALLTAAAPAGALEASPLGERIALVVEDDAKAAALIRLRLEAEGFEVVHAASAEAALVLAAPRRMALITLDLLLPDMDGWDLLARLKQMPHLRHTPVVIISIAPDCNTGFALGTVAVMQKPISRLDLYGTLVDLGLLPLSPGQELKILVVDDDPKAVELIALGITGLASSVLRAYGGREAIDTVRNELPDLIVLDLMMPEVSGFDVVVALNERADTARIPILVLTAKDVGDDDRARLSGEVAAVLAKGDFNGDRFVAEVHRAMTRGRRAADEVST